MTNDITNDIMARLRIGTSGFSYADWRGTFYPPGLSDAQMLSYYASRFNTTELNSTFYNLPAVPSLLGMLRKVPDGFDFAVKANRDVTHYCTKARETLPKFKETLRLIQEAGKLGPVLFQFPAVFRPTQENREHVQWLVEELAGYRTVIEVRHASWIREETEAWLRQRNTGFCIVDLPELGWLPESRLWVTGPTAYIRFHGRNTAKWAGPATRNERYDYHYSDEELKEWVPKVAGVLDAAENVYVYFNNHYRGQAASNAERLRELLASYLRGRLRQEPSTDSAA